MVHINQSFTQQQNVGNTYFDITVENMKYINLNLLNIYIMLYIIS